MNAVVLDHTALAALGAGNRLTSRLVDAAYNKKNRHVFVPAMCLAAATAQRVGIGDHVGLLSALKIVELDYADACLAGQMIADGVGWEAAHAVAVGRPMAEFPEGRPVVTAEPERYKGRGVTTIVLSG